MTSLSHAEIVRQAQDRSLDFDLDGDGLTKREELNYGLNPLAADSDGDKIPDGRELSFGSNPGISNLDAQDREQSLIEAEQERREREEQAEQRRIAAERERQQQQLQNRYLDHACQLLCWPRHQIDYASLYQDIAGDPMIGRPLDRLVLQSEIHSGTAPNQAIYLLAQSPWLQWQREQGEMSAEQIQDYAAQFLSEYPQQTILTTESQEDEEESFAI